MNKKASISTFPDMEPKADGFAAELKTRKIAFYEMKSGEVARFRDKERIKINNQREDNS